MTKDEMSDHEAELILKLAKELREACKHQIVEAFEMVIKRANLPALFLMMPEMAKFCADLSSTCFLLGASSA